MLLYTRWVLSVTPGGLVGSIWPPHVLALPYALLLASHAAVQLRRSWALPLVVASGGFLVHGHVCMVLCAAPFVLHALWLRRRALLTTASGRASLALVGLFAAPLAVDAAALEQSNLSAILRSSRTAPPSSLMESLVYTAGVPLIGAPTPKEAIFDGSWPGRLALRPAAFVWAALSLAGAWRARRRRVDPLSRRLACSAAIAGALAVPWGMLQRGDLLPFNSLFLHGAVALVLVAMVRVVAPRDRRAAALALGVAAGAWVVAPSAHLTLQPGGSSRYLEAVDQGLALDRGDRTRLVYLPDGAWCAGAIVANELERRGVTVRVLPAWGFAFGEERVVTEPLDSLTVWTVQDTRTMTELERQPVVTVSRGPRGPILDVR